MQGSVGLSFTAELANVRAMSCLPAAVSLAMLVASVPLPVLAADARTATDAAVTAFGAAATAAAAPAGAHTPWRCGESPGKFKPEDRDALKFWREQTGRFNSADPDGRIFILAEAWEKTRDPCFLYFQVKANAQAGRYLKAHDQAQELQAMGAQRTPVDIVEFIEQMRDGSHDCNVTLRLDDTAPPQRGEVQATYEGLMEGDDLLGRCVLAACSQSITLTQKEHTQALRVGRWTFVAQPGSEFTAESANKSEPAERRTIVVDDCSAPRSLTLKAAAIKPPVVTPGTPGTPVADVPTPAPTTSSHHSHKEMHRLGNLGIGVGAGLLLAGGVVLAVGAARWGSVYGAGLADGCNASELNGTAGCRAALAGPTQLRGVGAGVFGAGAGLLIPAMILRHTEPNKRALWLPIVGGVTAVIGVAMIGAGTASFNRAYGPDSTTAWEDRAAGSMHLHTVGAAFTGLGVGLLGSALARCMWRGSCGAKAKPSGRAGLEVAPGRLPGGAALAISGRF